MLWWRWGQRAKNIKVCKGGKTEWKGKGKDKKKRIPAKKFFSPFSESVGEGAGRWTGERRGSRHWVLQSQSRILLFLNFFLVIYVVVF